MPRGKLGAIPSPRHALLAAVPHRAGGEPPPQVAWVPPRLDLWGNDRYGCCVSAEEAFAKACHDPELFVSADQVIEWARAHGVLHRATLIEVLRWMEERGYAVEGALYNDGAVQGVDWSNERALQNAIAAGPVKIAIDHKALPPDAGERQGWFDYGGWVRQFANTDHCVSLCGYGTLGWLFDRLGVQRPSRADGIASGYLCFTWGTIGVVDHDWIMSTCAEAWVRVPTTVPAGGPPAPGPGPGPGPAPPPAPGPTPAGFKFVLPAPVRAGQVLLLEAPEMMPAGVYLVTPAGQGVLRLERLLRAQGGPE